MSAQGTTGATGRLGAEAGGPAADARGTHTGGTDTGGIDTGGPAKPKSRADLRSLARGGGLNVVGAAVSAVTQFLVVAAITRGFSKDAAGVFFTATSVFVLATMVAKLGTQTGLVYFIARFRSLGVPERIAACLRVAFTPVLVVSVLTAVVLFVFAPVIADVSVRGDSGDFATFLRTLAVFVPIAVVADTALAGTQGFRAMRPNVLIENIGRPLVQLLAVGTVAVLGAQALLPLAWVAPYAPAAVLAALWLRSLVRRTRRAGTNHDDARTDTDGASANRDGAPADIGADVDTATGPAFDRRELAGRFWRFSGVRGIASIAQQAMQRLDIVLVTALAGPAPAAVYTAATRFRVVGQLGNQALGQAVQPQLAEVLAHDDRGAAARLYQTATAWLVLITWPMYLVIAVYAPLVLGLFGTGYAEGAQVVRVLMLTMLVASACGMVSTVLIMAGRTTWNLANILVSLTVLVGLGLLLIPRLGLLGGAVAAAGAVLANNLLPLAQVGLALKLHPFGRGTVTAVALTGVSFGLVPLGAALLLGGGPVALVISMLLGGAGYAAGCLRFRSALRLNALTSIRRSGGARHR